MKQIFIVDGIINTVLGDVNRIDLPFDTSYWLGMQIDPDPQELLPRRKMTGALYPSGGFGR
jgi:hypothetical protein